MHRSSASLPAFWGLVFAGATMGVHALLGREASVLLAGVLMAMIGAIYIGFGVRDGRAGALVIECLGAAGFAACAIAGLTVSPWFIVAALAGHAGWDVLHHRAGAWASPPRWYIPYCAVYDLTAAIGLALLWFSRGFLTTAP